MKFGLRNANTRRYTKAANAVEIAQAAEAAGFESIWTVEHTVVPDGYQSLYPYAPSGKMAEGVNDIPLPDPLIWLAFIASTTERINLATCVLILPQHNPVAMAKEVAPLDDLSAGRVLLGVGGSRCLRQSRRYSCARAAHRHGGLEDHGRQRRRRGPLR